MKPTYHVFPNEPEAVALEVRKPSVSRQAAIWVAVISVVLFASIIDGVTGSVGLTAAQLEGTTPVLIALTLLLAAGTGALVYYLQIQWVHRVAAEEALKAHGAIVRRQVSAAVQEANSVSMSLNAALNTSQETAHRINLHIQEAEDLIAKASREFKGEAYHPFWDAVERAAELLAAVSVDLTTIANYARLYEDTLRQWHHDFPPFPVSTVLLQDPDAVIASYREVLRLVETNFQFSLIFGHRRTRAMHVAGFRTIGDAVYKIEEAVSSSYRSFVDSISPAL